MLISDKLKSFDFTYAEKEIVKVHFESKGKKKLQDNQHVKYQRDCIVRHHQ